MKPKFYASSIMLGLVSLLGFKQGQSQCLCPGGFTPDSIVYNQHFDSITAVNSNITFAQFPPTTGTLTCYKLSSNVTTVLNFDLYNKEAFDFTYLFDSFRRSRFTGPGSFSSTLNSPVTEYGPYDLTAEDAVATTDEVHVGPDTVFNNAYTQKYSSTVVPFIGTGTVVFDYLNTSTSTLLQGSSNYDLFVRAYTRLDVTLKYFYCPTSLLANNIKNFTAIRKNDNIVVQWTGVSEASNVSYEIQLSNDGRTFRSLYTQAPQGAGGSSVNYEYPYNYARENGSTLYFRIKYTDAAGKISYTAVLAVKVAETRTTGDGINIYPNPTFKRVAAQFDKPLTGSYTIDIINLTGQAVYSNVTRFNNSNTLQFDLNAPPASGIYYLRVRNSAGQQEYIHKLVIQH